MKDGIEGEAVMRRVTPPVQENWAAHPTNWERLCSEVKSAFKI